MQASNLWQKKPYGQFLHVLQRSTTWTTQLLVLLLDAPVQIFWGQCSSSAICIAMSGLSPSTAGAFHDGIVNWVRTAKALQVIKSLKRKSYRKPLSWPSHHRVGSSRCSSLLSNPEQATSGSILVLECRTNFLHPPDHLLHLSAAAVVKVLG